MTKDNTVKNCKCAKPRYKWWCEERCKEHQVPAVDRGRLWRQMRQGRIHWMLDRERRAFQSKGLEWSWCSGGGGMKRKDKRELVKMWTQSDHCAMRGLTIVTWEEEMFTLPLSFYSVSEPNTSIYPSLPTNNSHYEVCYFQRVMGTSFDNGWMDATLEGIGYSGEIVLRCSGQGGILSVLSLGFLPCFFTIGVPSWACPFLKSETKEQRRGSCPYRTQIKSICVLLMSKMLKTILGKPCLCSYCTAPGATEQYNGMWWTTSPASLPELSILSGSSH